MPVDIGASVVWDHFTNYTWCGMLSQITHFVLWWKWS